MKISLLAMLLLFTFSSAAHAFLENLRHGYTSCSTCHYNRQGGGFTTAYGQALGEEIMFMKRDSHEELKEEDFSKDKWFRAGTDLRALQILKDDPEKTKAVFIPMQADAHALFLLPRTQAQITYGAKSTNSFGKRKTEWLVRAYHVDFAALDSIHLKAGKFLPPFGLPLIEHNLLIKKELGFDQNQESLNYLLTAAHENLAYDFYRFEKSVEGQDTVRGYGGQFRFYILDHHMISISHHSSEKQKKYGLSGFISIPWQQSALMLEADESFVSEERGRAYFARYLIEPRQGFKPYVQVEGFNPNIQNSENEIQGWAAGLQLLPANHWDVMGQLGQNRMGSGDRETVAFLNLHYYWQTD
jgi:hypothetical protein